MALAPDRERQGRQQKYNDIGNEGRITGIKPPSNVPRDSTGHERPSAFFDPDRQHSDGDDASTQASAPTKKHVNGGASSSKTAQHASQSPGGARGRDRPDLFTDLGERGRKTGVQVAQGARDDDGYETVSGFFKSPAATTAYAPSSVGASSPATAKKRAPASTSAAAAAAASASAARSMPSPEPDDDFDHHQFGGEGFGDEDESDMQLDDGSSLTPSAFQRKHKAHLPPSALRHSVTAGAGASASPKSVSRRPPVVDSESEEEAPVNKKVVGGRKSVGGKGGLSMLGASAKGKGKARVTAPISDSDDDDDDEQDEDEAVPIVVNKKTAASKGKAINGRLAHLATNGSGGSNASSRSGRSSRRESIGSPLLKLGKGGKPVAAAFKKDVKGKGKQVVRSDSEPEEERDESVEMEQFDFPEPDQDDDQDEEEEEEESEEEEAPRPRANGKGKAPRVSNASTASSAPSPRKGSQASKKASTSQQAKKKAPAAEPIRKRVRSDSEEDPDGVRRSSRQRLQPVEYWRNERVVYKRRPSGMGIEEVVRIPKSAQAWAAKKKTGGNGIKRSQSQRVKSEQIPEEEGVDDMTDPDGLVWSWEGNAEVSRRIAFTAKMIDPRPTHNNKFMFQKIYTELDYLAGGILQIPAGAEKPTKPAKDNSYMFYCIEGSVSVVVHRTRFAIGPGATFFVPRGNSYSITATSHRDVKLFFTQGRRVLEDSLGNTWPDTLEDSRRKAAEQDDSEEDEDEEEEDEEEEDEENVNEYGEYVREME